MRSLMRRACPNCEQATIPWALIGLQRRRCPVCRVVVGLHWLHGPIYWCVMAGALGFIGLALQLVVSPARMGLWGIAALASWFLAGGVVPLETKAERRKR